MPTNSVDGFLRELDHPLKARIESLRRAILASDPAISESIKWNAPNFRYDGEDRVTFRLRPEDRTQLIFHRGAKVRTDTDRFEFFDSTGLLRFAAPDRAVLDLTGSDADALEPVIVELVGRWVRS